jgi:hypothetical protein
MNAPRRLYLVVNQQAVGPFTEQEVAGKLLAGEVTEQTPACPEGAQEWSELHRTMSPELMRQTLEYRRASSMFHSSAGAASNPPAPATPPSQSFVGSTSMIGPAAGAAPRPMPAVSFVEANGTPIQVPSGFQMPSGIVTSPPAAYQAGPAAAGGQSFFAGAQPAAAAPAPAPASTVAPADMGLAVEAEGADSSSGSKSNFWKIFAGVAAVLAVAAALAYAPAKKWWDAREAFARGTAALQGGQIPEAMVAFHAASNLQPDSGVYLTALQDARRKFVDRIKERGADEPALAHLVFARGIAATYEAPLGDDSLQTLKDWMREVEPNANKQIRQAFDQPFERLQELLAPHEGKLRTYFATPAEKEEATKLHDQWRTLRDAYAAWDKREPVAAVKELAKISDDLRKGAFEALFNKTESLRQELEGKLRNADELASGNRYMETRPIFTALEPYVDLLPAIKLERKRIQLAGENYYASKLVESVRAKNEKAAQDSLKNYMDFRGTPLADDQIAAFLQTKEFEPFLDRLREFGLHPKTPAARQNYADVILVASSLPNFTDPAPAREFLRDAYYAWGAQELEKGRAAPAAYLALLAQKYESTEAASLFDEAREKIAASFTIAIQPAPIAINAPKASRSFTADLEASTFNSLRGGLPEWIRWQTEAPAQGSEPLITLRAAPVLAQFNRRTDQLSRTAKGRFRFEDIIEENPAWYQAQDMVARAESGLEQARNAYQQAKAMADQTAQQAANSGSSGLALFGAIISGVSQGVSSAGVDNAARALAQARSTAAQTPRQIRKENIQDVEWTEIDHVNQFDAEIRLDLYLADKVLHTRKFTAKTQHLSTEREGGYGGRVKPMQKQEPSIETIETKLASDLKAQLQVVGTNEFLGQVKRALSDYISQQATDMDAETRANTLLSLELLWWKHPLFNSNAMRTPDLLGRFGDVIVK